LSISTVKKNVVANFASNGWTALIAVILIPLCTKLLGIEAWGVIGIFVSLQTICVLLDLGLSATLNREMARLSLRADKAQEMHNLVRTLELIYWGIAAVIGFSVFALAPLIANHWVQAQQLSPETIKNAIRIMALALSFQWPFGLYSSGLFGLQRHVLLSGVSVGTATLRGVGAILVLWKVSPTLQAFFLWQVVISLLQTCLAGWFLRQSLPRAESAPRFQRQLLWSRWRFAAGISGISVMAVILLQMDKVILSRLLTLEIFGYYVLASAVAMGLYLLVTPVFSALYPRFTQLVSLGDEEGLKQLYHDSCQLMSAVILPIAIVIALFSRETLLLWTGNPRTVNYTHSILSLLIIGTALNGLLNLPYALQLAHGWTKLALSVNACAVLILAPSIVLMASFYGAVGAALVWVMFNSALVLIGIQLMHRRVLKGEQWKWYFEDVGLPLAVSVGTALLCLLIVPTGGARVPLLTFLTGATLFTAGSTFLATPVTRAGLVSYIRSQRGRALNMSR